MNRYGIISKFGIFISKVARIPSQCCDLSRERLSVEKTLFESSLKQGRLRVMDAWAAPA